MENYYSYSIYQTRNITFSKIPQTFFKFSYLEVLLNFFVCKTNGKDDAGQAVKTLDVRIDERRDLVVLYLFSPARAQVPGTTLFIYKTGEKKS